MERLAGVLARGGVAVAALLLVLVGGAGSVAYAQGCTQTLYFLGAVGYTSAMAAGTAAAAGDTAGTGDQGNGTVFNGWKVTTCTESATQWLCSAEPGSITDSPGSTKCEQIPAACNPANQMVTNKYGGAIGPGPCPVTPCSANQGKTVDTVVESGPQAPGTITYDQGGCAMQVTSGPTNVVGCHGGCAVQTATYTGAQQQGGTPQSQSGSDCVASSGGTFCSEAGTGKNCGTFNGDEVCPQSLPPGTCQSYASGGVACTASASTGAVPTPPGPNNGTAGTPATPTGQVQAAVTPSGGTASTQVTTNYYSSTVVAGSTTPVAASAGGANVGNAGTGTSGSSSGGDGKGNAGTSCGNGKTASGGDCVNDSFGGGDVCSNPPVCSGDPIQCAQAQEEFLMRCQNPVGADDVFGAGQTPTAAVLKAPGEGGDVSQMVDTSTFLTGSCLQDRVLSLADWGSITLPLSQFCWVWQALGVMVMTCAWIGAAKIVVGVNK